MGKKDKGASERTHLVTIEQTAMISVFHLKHATRVWLDTLTADANLMREHDKLPENYPVGLSRTMFGWRIYCGHDYGRATMDDMPEDLAKCMDVALALKCSYISFDVDAQPLLHNIAPLYAADSDEVVAEVTEEPLATVEVPEKTLEQKDAEFIDSALGKNAQSEADKHKAAMKALNASPEIAAHAEFWQLAPDSIELDEMFKKWQAATTLTEADAIVELAKAHVATMPKDTLVRDSLTEEDMEIITKKYAGVAPGSVSREVLRAEIVDYMAKKRMNKDDAIAAAVKHLTEAQTPVETAKAEAEMQVATMGDMIDYGYLG